MKDINYIVGQNIRDLRQHNGLTTTVLAKMLSVSQQQLSRYERGINKIDVSVVFKIINIFHMSLYFLSQIPVIFFRQSNHRFI